MDNLVNFDPPKTKETKLNREILSKKRKEKSKKGKQNFLNEVAVFFFFWKLGEYETDLHQPLGW